MPKYTKAATVTVADASISIAPAGVAAGNVVEVHPTAAGIWVHITGGTASVGGADCIHIEQNGRVQFVMHGAALTAIREASTSAPTHVAILAAHS